MAPVLTGSALFDQGRNLGGDPLGIVLPNGLEHRLVNFRPEFIGLVPIGKPLEIIKRPGFDLFGDFYGFTFGLGSILGGVLPVRSLPKLPPVPIKSETLGCRVDSLSPCKPLACPLRAFLLSGIDSLTQSRPPLSHRHFTSLPACDCIGGNAKKFGKLYLSKPQPRSDCS